MAELSPEKQEIARLENLYNQLTLGSTRISGVLGDEQDPDEQQKLAMQLADLQRQQAEAAGQLQGFGQQANPMQGILMANELYGDQQPQQAPGPMGGDQAGSPAQAEIRQLEQMLAQLQGGGGGGGMPQQQPFQPTMSPQNMGELYSAMAGGADDPAQVGNQYAQRMQYNDMLRNQYLQTANVKTAAQRARPVGGGYMDQEGFQVIPIWEPSADGTSGRIREQRLSQRFPDTIKIGDIPYVRNHMQPDIGAADAFIPAQNAQSAGQRQAAYQEEADLGAARAVTRKEAESLAADMKLQDSRIQDILFAPNFSESVGPFDALIRKAGGAALGGEDSLLNRQVQILHNQLTTVQVADWKGAISNAELKFFHASVPDTTDHHQVWHDWYTQVFQPTQKFALLRASGQIDYTNSNLKDYLQSGGWETGVTNTQGTDPYSQLLADPEVQKALGNE